MTAAPPRAPAATVTVDGATTTQGTALVTGMSKPEAEALVTTIARRWGRDYRAVSMWMAPGQYRVIVTERSTNRQFDVLDPSWSPSHRAEYAPVQQS